ncbi:DUF4382 domain-containing protein [Alkalilimnicola ehrlichii]|nr:DUF4382 domain-containing protein [Alkalilimnicola ehrlichii]
MKRTTKWLPVLIGALALSGCDDWSWRDFFTGESGRGELTLALTDGPVDDAEEVVIQLRGLELHPAEGDTVRIEFDQAETIDLLQLQGEQSHTILSRHRIKGGEYTRVRLLIDDASTVAGASYVTVDGSQYDLRLGASGQTSGTRIVVPADGRADYTLDVDLRKSLTRTTSSAGDFQLTPFIRVVDTERAGSITGDVASRLMGDENCWNTQGQRHGAAVYVFEGHNASIRDIRRHHSDPITTAIVDPSDRTYTAGFIPPGNYTVAFTCQAGRDDPTRNSNVSFGNGVNVTVERGRSTRHDFQ